MAKKPKISNKSKEQQKTWEDKILRAKKVRLQWKELFKVDLARDYFDGKQRPPGYPASEWITINNVYAHLKAQLPSLYAADPYFYVRLKRSFTPDPNMIVEYGKKGKIRQAMLNYLKEELQLKIKARLCIQDAHFAYGVLKSHHSSEMIKNPDAGEPVKGEDGETLLSDPKTGETMLEPDYIPVNSRYKLTRIHPDDFLWDEDAGPLEDDWAWVAQCIREPYQDVVKNPLFHKAAVDRAKNKGGAADDEHKRRQDRKKGEVKGYSDTDSMWDKHGGADPHIITRWEIYNLKQGTWLVIAEGGEEPLLPEEPIPPGIERHPFSVLRFTLRDDSPYPIPPISQGIDPSNEYNMARSDLLRHRKRFNRKYAYLQGAVDEEQLAMLETGQDGALIGVKQLGAVDAIKDAPLDQMRYMELGYLKQDMIELFGGAHDEARGIAGSETATQAGILDKRLEIKEGDAMSMVIDFVRDIARKLDQLVQTYIERDEAVRVSGPQGELWEMVRTDDYEAIEGEFEYSVNVGATVPRMPQMERASWMAFLTMLANFPHLLQSKRLLKRMAEMHHIEDDQMIAELQKIWQQMMSGQAPFPGNTGSQPGVGEERPVSAMGGLLGGANG